MDISVYHGNGPVVDMLLLIFLENELKRKLSSILKYPFSETSEIKGLLKALAFRIVHFSIPKD